jgi:hypothetical protein
MIQRSPLNPSTVTGTFKPKVASVVNMMANWPGVNSLVLLSLELRQSLREGRRTNEDSVDRVFRNLVDPFSYESNPQEQERLRLQEELLDTARAGSTFRKGLEIGPGEGLFTEVVARQCDSLLVVDLAPTALARTEKRCAWGSHVRFARWDLLADEMPGKFDLIVATGLLEYFTRRRTLAIARAKLIDGLADGGYLLVESTRADPVVEGSWWARVLAIRGRWINEYVAAHPAVSVERQLLTDKFAITLLRKKAAPTGNRR